MKSQVWSPLQLCHVVCAWYACVDTRNSTSPLKLKFQWSLSPDHCVVVEPFFHVRLLCNNCTVLARQRVDCRFCREEYGEETLATVVSGLALGCLLALPDHHPFVVVRSGVVRTLPARQQERAKPWHPVDAGLAVARRVTTRLSNRTVPPATGHCRRRCLFGILGGRPVFWGRRQSWTGGKIAFLPGVGRGRVFRVPRQSCHCCLWLLYRRKGVRSGDGSNAQRRTVGSAGRSANSWVVGHRSTWSQGPTIVSRSDCVRLLTCSPNRGCSRIF